MYVWPRSTSSSNLFRYLSGPVVGLASYGDGWWRGPIRPLCDCPLLFLPFLLLRLFSDLPPRLLQRHLVRISLSLDVVDNGYCIIAVSNQACVHFVLRVYLGK